MLFPLIRPTSTLYHPAPPPLPLKQLYNNKAEAEGVTEEEEVQTGENGEVLLAVFVTAILPAEVARPAANTLAEKLASAVTVQKVGIGNQGLI